MPDFKIPEGEKFFAFMVWVALAGAALILAIDYTMKRQLLSLAKELREGGLNEQAVKGGFASPANPNGRQPFSNVDPVPVDDSAGLETENAVDHIPFPIRAANQPRESNGRFAAKDPDDNGRDRDSEVPRGNPSVES